MHKKRRSNKYSTPITPSISISIIHMYWMIHRAKEKLVLLSISLFSNFLSAQYPFGITSIWIFRLHRIWLVIPE